MARLRTWNSICRLRVSDSIQLIEQGLGALEVGEFEALGKPAANISEHAARFLAFALLLEQARKAGRRAQFEKSRLLAARYIDCVAKAALRLRLLGRDTHQ